MGKSKTKSASKKSRRQVETTVSMASSSLSSISNPRLQSPSPLSTCFIICAFVSVAVISSILTYAATTTFTKCEAPKANDPDVKYEDLSKIYQYMEKMDNWFVTHNHYYVNPDNVESSSLKCRSSACDYKRRPPPPGWPKLPAFDWKEMNESPYPIPEAYQTCKMFNSTAAA